MRKIGKYRRKKQKKIIITSLSLLLFLCVGYAAFSTNLSLKAKGNIKQKIYTPTEIKNEFCNTTEGDGLYKDIYEEGKCTYKGINPNNYIIFNNETWRIISIGKDDTVKIIKNEFIAQNKDWDNYFDSESAMDVYSNNWLRPATINTFLFTRNLLCKR